MIYKKTLSTIVLLSTLAPLTVGRAHEGKGSTIAKTSAEAQHASRPVIEFGHEGGNLRPYRIAIDASGQVTVLEGNPALKTDRIPAEKVRELERQASGRSFWESSAVAEDAQAQKVLPDFGFVFIKIRTRGRHRRVIQRRGVETGPLGRFYAELSDLVLGQP